VPETVKKERNQALLEAQAEVSLAGNLRFIGTRQQVLVEGLSVRDERRQAKSAAPSAEQAKSAADENTLAPEATTPETLAQLTGRTMCDRIVVFDAPLRLIGRLVDVDIQAAGAWSLAGDVADGLAKAIPIEHLFSEDGSSPPPALYDIDLKTIAGGSLAPSRPSGPNQADSLPGA